MTRQVTASQPRPGQTTAEGVVGTTGDQAEGGQAAADILPGEQGVRVVGAELVEAAHTAVVDSGIAEPEALSAEEVDTVGTVGLAAGEGVELAGLPPDSQAEVAGFALRAQAIAV